MNNEPAFEEKYADILQNIELGIADVYRQNPELSDWDALDAVEALIRRYSAEAHGSAASPARLPALAQQAFDAAGSMCELRLGREQLLDKNDQPANIDMQPTTVDEIVACLKRIRRSIRFWSKQGGRQGYVNYIRGFF